MAPRSAPVSTALTGLLAGWLVSGCPDSSETMPPVLLDGGGAGDADAPDPLLDTDGDGLCDETENRRGTDPFEPDTDADGYTDWVEISFGYDPTLPASPDREIVHLLREDPESSAAAQLTVRVRGRGEDYTGAFEGLNARDPTGTTATDFYDHSIALVANPEENAAIVDEEAQRFRGVVGLTELHFEVHFRFGDVMARRCIRAFPFRYGVKRSDGRFVGYVRQLLVVLPPGDRVSTGEWCARPPPCR